MKKFLLPMSRRQQHAVLILLAIIVIIQCTRFASVYYHQYYTKPVEPYMLEEIKLIEKEIARPYTMHIHPFHFNPNTLDSAGFIKLGLTPKLTHTILHYRQKGGHFYSAQQLKKIYGMPDSIYQQLHAFVLIDQPEIKHNIQVVELNSCDSNALIQLPGIGSATANRIIAYRSVLGGFYSINQLDEVWGMKEEVLKKCAPFLKINLKHIKKISINKATWAEFNQHPYLQGEIATAIVEFRKAHDYHIEKLSDIQEIKLLNEKIFRKIVPYLTL